MTERAAIVMPTSEQKQSVTRLRVRNYKSIGKCDLSLAPLTLLVGRNGAGKSNLLDALRFVTDSLQTTLDHAIKARGGIEAVRRKSTGHPRNFAIDLELMIDGSTASYGFEIAARSESNFVVKRERLECDGGVYEVREAEIVECSVETPPRAVKDRLYLVTISGLPEFRPVFDVLSSMGFYNLNPEAMKELQSPDAGDLLLRDGSNIASVVARLPGPLRQRTHDYLQTIAQDIAGFERVSLGPKETLQFRQEVVGAKHPWRFYAISMSDGTLRALGILVAVTQLGESTPLVRLVGIEEPETALHPAAAVCVMDALREASSHTQVIVTTHSPDLLDQVDIDVDGIFVVMSEKGTTSIAPLDQASKQAIRDHLFTPGELHRMSQLEQDKADLQRQQELPLFSMTPDGDE